MMVSDGPLDGDGEDGASDTLLPRFRAAEGDEALTHAILGVRERKGIVIVFTHRPSAIAGVDQVLVMNNGRMQTFGPKDEILPKVLQRPAPPPRSLKVVPESGSAGA